jgi:hypothetical protein
MKRQSLTILIALLLLVACVPTGSNASPTPSPTVLPTPVPNVLYVDPARDLGSISPYLYGTNYGPMHAVVVDKMPMVESAGFTALRFPGGAWTDAVDIQTFQIDTFIAFCKQVGAIPTISVRLLNGKPETAAELVRYTNIEKKYGVIYWSIGNEPSIYTMLKQADYDYTTVNLNQDWRAIALAMKAVDPTIKLMGPELHQWNDSLTTTPKDSSGRDWMIEFLKANGDLVDVVTVHRYPLYSPGGQDITVQSLRANTRKWAGEVEYLRSLIRQVTGRDIPIAYTEVNSDPSSISGQVASPDSFYNAIWYADILGQMMQSKVFMVNQWVISQRSTGLGLLNGDAVRPTFFVFPMYKNFGSEQVYAASGVTEVDVFAAKRQDGTLTVLVINLLDTEQRIPLQVQGVALSKAEVWLFDATHKAEDLGQQSFPSDGRLILPAQSITLYAIGK